MELEVILISKVDGYLFSPLQKERQLYQLTSKKAG